jgi:cellulose biosynthesis protein BcsQ
VSSGPHQTLKRAEAVRRCTRADWESGTRSSRVVAVTNNKGGVGKTTIAINLAVYIRALYEDLPILILALDEQPMPDRMFALGAEAPRETTATALRWGSLDSAIRLGQYGIHYLPTSPQIFELKREIDDPFYLRRVLGATNWRGLVIIDTKSDLEILTQNAIAASDLAIVAVKDEASLLEARKIFELLDRWGRPRDVARILLSLVDLRIKYARGEDRDILALLISGIRRLGLPLFDGFISRSPKVESLYTNPEGRPLSILHGAEGSLVHRQMRHLADDLARLLDLAAVIPRVDDEPGARSAVDLRAASLGPSELRLVSPAPAASAADAPAGQTPVVVLKGMTRQAARCLPARTLEIVKFPFRIGRRPFAENDLMIADLSPWQVSRNHIELIERDGRIGAVDRGSRVGSLVDEQRLGGSHGERGPVFFEGPRGTLVLGNRRSPFVFEVLIRPRDGSEARREVSSLELEPNSPRTARLNGESA